MQIINELEPGPRGVYAGAIGYLDFAGNLDFCIAIRTVVLEHGTGLRAGRRRHRRRLESRPPSTTRPTTRRGRCCARSNWRGQGCRSWCWSSTTTTRSPSTWSSTWASWGPRSRCAATTPWTWPACGRWRPIASSCRPGPGRPEDAGVSCELIRAARRRGADPRRVPRPPGDRPRVRRRGSSRRRRRATARPRRWPTTAVASSRG